MLHKLWCKLKRIEVFNSPRYLPYKSLCLTIKHRLRCAATQLQLVSWNFMQPNLSVKLPLVKFTLHWSSSSFLARNLNHLTIGDKVTAVIRQDLSNLRLTNNSLSWKTCLTKRQSYDGTLNESYELALVKCTIFTGSVKSNIYEDR